MLLICRRKSSWKSSFVLYVFYYIKNNLLKFQFVKSLWNTAGNYQTFIPHDSVFTVLLNNSIHTSTKRHFLNDHSRTVYTRNTWHTNTVHVYCTAVKMNKAQYAHTLAKKLTNLHLSERNDSHSACSMIPIMHVKDRQCLSTVWGKTMVIRGIGVKGSKASWMEVGDSGSW